MMSGSQINEMQLEAAARASREGAIPLVPWNRGELTSAPFLGEYIPPGWREALWADIAAIPVGPPKRGHWGWSGENVALCIDASGFGSPSEPAASIEEAEEWIARLLAADTQTTFGVGILEAGQFQVYLGLYVKEDGAPGHPVNEDIGLCPDCGGEDDAMDGHDCPFDDEDRED